jgi:hypothetical protein
MLDHRPVTVNLRQRLTTPRVHTPQLRRRNRPKSESRCGASNAGFQRCYSAEASAGDFGAGYQPCVSAADIAYRQVNPRSSVPAHPHPVSGCVSRG